MSLDFKQIKDVLQDYRDKGNPISPYFAVQFDHFIQYFYTYANVDFITKSIGDADLFQEYEDLKNKHQNFSEQLTKCLDFNMNGISEDIITFHNKYIRLYGNIQERIEGCLIEDVFLERFSQLSLKQGFSFNVIDKRQGTQIGGYKVRPDAVIQVDSFKIALEFKSRHFQDRWLLIKKYHKRKY
ncbi:MAG: hypothetical protein ACTSU9_17360 [Promethearchaeota archaeon]